MTNHKWFVAFCFDKTLINALNANKSFVNFFKSCPIQSETLVARRNERNTLSVKAHFWELENFLQVKKFSKTNYKHRLTSKIIQWMIFDGWDLHLNSWYFLFWVIFCKNLFVHDWYSTDSRKISHREVFLESACRFSIKGAFLLQKHLFYNPNLGL